MRYSAMILRLVAHGVEATWDVALDVQTSMSRCCVSELSRILV